MMKINYKQIAPTVLHLLEKPRQGQPVCRTKRTYNEEKLRQERPMIHGLTGTILLAFNA